MRTITLNDDDMREPCDHNDIYTCGHCNRSWCGTCTPTPSARCPFEYEHEHEDEVDVDFPSDDEGKEFAAFLANNDIKIDPNTPLAPHGGCNRSGCTTCFPPKDEPTGTDFPYRDDADDEVKLRSPDYEAEFLDASIVNDIVRENTLRNQSTPQANGPCPICGEPEGFHDDNIHRKNIDPKYLLEKGWHNAK